MGFYLKNDYTNQCFIYLLIILCITYPCLCTFYYSVVKGFNSIYCQLLHQPLNNYFIYYYIYLLIKTPKNKWSVPVTNPPTK